MLACLHPTFLRLQLKSADEEPTTGIAATAAAAASIAAAAAESLSVCCEFNRRCLPSSGSTASAAAKPVAPPAASGEFPPPVPPERFLSLSRSSPPCRRSLPACDATACFFSSSSRGWHGKCRATRGVPSSTGHSVFASLPLSAATMLPGLSFWSRGGGVWKRRGAAASISSRRPPGCPWRSPPLRCGVESGGDFIPPTFSKKGRRKGHETDSFLLRGGAQHKGQRNACVEHVIRCFPVVLPHGLELPHKYHAGVQKTLYGFEGRHDGLRSSSVVESNHHHLINYFQP